MITNLFPFIQTSDIQLFIKVMALILIGLYAIFALMLANKIRSFNKILFLPSNSGGGLMQLLALTLFLAVLSLFFVTLVIV
ncbi:MAG TPA: DUF5657 family protein [Patescibacteria group bacterium]